LVRMGIEVDLDKYRINNIKKDLENAKKEIEMENEEL
jgi:hypothetical protein